GRRARLRYVACRSASANGSQDIVIEFREETQPVTVYLSCELGTDASHVRATLRLVANQNRVATVSQISILDLGVDDAAQSHTCLRGVTGGFLDGEISISDGNYKIAANMPPSALKPWKK